MLKQKVELHLESIKSISKSRSPFYDPLENNSDTSLSELETNAVLLDDVSSSQESNKSQKREQKEKKLKTFEDKNKILSPLEAIGIVSVLEDTIDQLGIIKYILAGGVVTLNEGYKTIDERFGKETEKQKLFPDEDDVPVMTELTKIQRDRAFMESVLQSTTKDIISSSTFGSLQQAVETVNCMRKEEEQLIKEEKMNAQEEKRLNGLLTQSKKEMQQQLNLRAEMIVHLKDQLHDEMVRSEMEYRYVDHWEDSRESQGLKLLTNEENALSEAITSNQRDIDLENRCNSEIEMFITQNQQELEEQIEVWTERYDRELEENESTLLKVKMDRENNMKELTSLEELFKMHKEEMDLWLEHKEVTRIEKQRFALETKMAIRIQTWWRAILFIRFINRRKKKKGGKDKGKRKKGGGKNK